MISKQIRAWSVVLVLSAAIVVVSAQDTAPSVTILYDNTVARQECKADWGFAALVGGTEQPILFDSGAKGEVLVQNIQAVSADLSRTGLIVISHAHGDHTGGLQAALARIPGATVYLPAASPVALLEAVTRAGGKPTSPTGPVTVCKDVWLTGTLGGQIKEQALVIATSKGLVVLTGCSHPGIVPMLEQAREAGKAKIYAVMGGFHLLQHSDAAVSEIVSRFRALGVEKVGASHCTGEKAIAAFRSAYGSDFIELGAGRTVRFD